ncbi:MAG: nitroreductase family deazaflavin-dependent oxidoreductase [Chloroflexota bacterium]
MMDSLAPEQFCYLTTKGRKTGKAYTVEIWFATSPGSDTLYMLSGGGSRSDWVKNIQANPTVNVRVKDRTFTGTARIIDNPQEDNRARRLVVAKYYNRNTLNTSGWEAEALPIAIDLRPTEAA